MSERNQELLEAELGQAFQSGDLGFSALLLWELRGRFPDSAVAHIYAKKLMRLPELAGLTRDSLAQETKAAYKDKNFEQLSLLTALGLLLFPKDRYFAFLMAESGSRLAQAGWIPLALDPLGEPSDDDIELLNARAAMALDQGDFTLAEEYFSTLVKRNPQSDVLCKNYAAALAGQKRFATAIGFLESKLEVAADPLDFMRRLASLYRSSGLDVKECLQRLDEEYFAIASNKQSILVRCVINIFLERFDLALDALDKALLFGWDGSIEFERSEILFMLGRYKEAFEAYRSRFIAHPHLRLYEVKTKPYRGEKLEDETLVIWFEQGIGEEILFSHLLADVSERVVNVTIVIDGRLLASVQERFPTWKFIDRKDCKELPVSDYACASGDLLELFLGNYLLDQRKFLSPWITANEKRLEAVRSSLQKENRLRIAISWRGGESTNGKLRSMSLERIMEGLDPSEDIDVISLQYDEGHEREVMTYGDRRVALSGIDNRYDLPGVFALLSCCDAVVTIDNALAHFGSALGIPTYVIVPAGQTSYRWMNQQLREIFFPSAKVFVQKVPGDWAWPVSEAWRTAIREIKVRKSG